MSDAKPPAEEEKKKTRKTEPLTVEAFQLETSTQVAAVSKLAEFFNGPAKKRLTLPEGSPAKPEFTQFIRDLEHLHVLYKKLLKKEKAQSAAKTGEKKNRGFKAERFVNPDCIQFVNTHCEFPADLQLKPLAEAGGYAIWSNAQCTQTFQWYIEQQNLKNPKKRSEVRLNGPLKILFAKHLGGLKEKQCWERDGETWIAHTTLQSLIPKLLDSDLPILPSLLTDDVKATNKRREDLLSERTAANRAKRDAQKKAEKAEKAAAAAAKAGAK